MGKYDIYLPNDLECEINDLDIGFMKDATPGVTMQTEIEDSEFLDKQFIIV